jgi:hypothetical protein
MNRTTTGVVEGATGAQGRTTALAPRKGNAAALTGREGYLPGRIRNESDAELAAVRGLVRDFPEYGRLPHDAIVDAASTYRTEERREELACLAAEGVPLDWRRDEELNCEEGI